MAIAKKRAPSVTVQGMERIVSKIYDDLNDVINSVNQSVSESRSLTTGKEGDLRVLKDTSSETYKLEAYTKDGWASTNLTIIKER